MRILRAEETKFEPKSAEDATGVILKTLPSVPCLMFAFYSKGYLVGPPLAACRTADKSGAPQAAALQREDYCS